MLMETYMKVSGKTIKRMDMVITLMLMEPLTLVNGKTTSNMAKE
jgi:hypothetical protein